MISEIVIVTDVDSRAKAIFVNSVLHDELDDADVLDDLTRVMLVAGTRPVTLDSWVVKYVGHKFPTSLDNVTRVKL